MTALRRWFRRLSLASLALMAIGLVLAVAALVSVWFAVRSPEGTNWLINRATAWVPGLKVIEAQGSLWGDFKARRVELDLGQGSRLTLINPQWQGLRAYRVAWAPWRLQWHIDALSADSADLVWVSPPNAAPTTRLAPPTHLNLPVGLRIGSLALGRFQSNVSGAAPFLDVKGALEIQQPGATAGQNEHRVVLSHLRYQQWTLSGQVRVATQGDMAVDGRVRAVGSEVKGDEANLKVEGPLQHLLLQATVAVAGRAGQPEAQRLTVDGEVAPFSPWPIPRAQIQAERFDVQRLAAALPATALSGRVTVVPRSTLPVVSAPDALASGTVISSAPVSATASASKGSTPAVTAKVPVASGLPGLPALSKQVTEGAADVVANVDLRNDLAGLWDAGRVPLVSVQAQLVLPGQADTSQIAALGRHGVVDARVVLPAASGRSPGTVELRGQWQLDDLQRSDLRATLSRVELQALHSAAPPLLLQGTLGASGQADKSWKLEGTLDGRDNGGKAIARPAKATFLAHWSPEKLLLDSLKLVSGDSQAVAKGQWAAVKEGGWNAEGQVDVKAFDPAAWVPWPRPLGDAVQRTRLDGALTATLKAATNDPATWRGKGEASLKDSLLLGVPLKARSQWQLADGQGAAQAGLVIADLAIQAAGNEVQADVRWPLAARPAQPDKPTPPVAGAQIKAQLR
ncbi:MAG: hypothetical protein EOP40_10510, partial [Rubrivivax sp.]